MLCQDQLGEISLISTITQTAKIQPGYSLNNHQWKLLTSVIAGHNSDDDPLDTTEISEAELEIFDYQDLIKHIQHRLFELDIQQEKLGKQIPPGPQRIRGIAGSGKTIILCQRAAHLHLKYPNYNIAYIFFNRSLYDQIREQVDHWLKRYSNHEVTLEQAQRKLKILHSWGAKDEPGFYSLFRDQLKLPKYSSTKLKGSPQERLAQHCSALLQHEANLKPCFDAVLIDEGQDLVVADHYKYQERQPIYWLAWQSLKPITPEDPHLRRLYWAYDEFQSLNAQKVPEYKEILGIELAAKLVGKRAGPTYQGGILKNEVMECCFRTPSQILLSAFAIGTGLLRPQGRFYRFTKRELTEIGFSIQGNFRGNPRTQIQIGRPQQTSRNPLDDLNNSQSLIEFHLFKSKQEEIEAAVNRIQYALEAGLTADRQILLIDLGENNATQTLLAQTFAQRKINFFVPGKADINDLTRTGNRSIFWHPGAVTITNIHRAKGNEALWVWVLGLEKIAKNESDQSRRNQLFAAMTRTKGWLWMSGIQSIDAADSLYDELQTIVDSRGTIQFYNRVAEQPSS